MPFPLKLRIINLLIIFAERSAVLVHLFHPGRIRQDQRTWMLETPVEHLIARLAVPTTVSMLITSIYNMADTYFVSQIGTAEASASGTSASAAVGIVFSAMAMIQALAFMFGMGSGTNVSHLLGMGKRKEAEVYSAVGFFSAVAAGVLIAVLGNVFNEPLMRLLGATETAMPYALDYGYIIVAGTIFNIFPCGAMSIVRGNGGPKTAMLSMLTGFTVNMIGDPLTIYGFHWGVKGAAIATVLGQAASAVVCIVYLARKKGTVQLTKQSFTGWARFVPKTARLGLSSFVTQLAIVVVLYFQNNLLVKYGALSKYGAEIPLTALGVTIKVFTMLQNAITGLCSGAQPIISYNYGRNLRSRVRQILKLLVIFSAALMGIATIWFQLAPMSIVRIFGSADPLYNEFSVKCLRIFLMLIFLDSFQMVGSSFLQSIGKPLSATALVLFRQIIVQVPALLILGKLFGIDGLLYAGALSSLLVGILSILFLVREWIALGKQAQ